MWVPHDIRDQLVDFVRYWSQLGEILAIRFIRWLGIAASKFYDWKARYGKVNEHNSWIPRDFWLEDWEKQAIREFFLEHPDEGLADPMALLFRLDRVTTPVLFMANDNDGAVLLEVDPSTDELRVPAVGRGSEPASCSGESSCRWDGFRDTEALAEGVLPQYSLEPILMNSCTLPRYCQFLHQPESRRHIPVYLGNIHRPHLLALAGDSQR